MFCAISRRKGADDTAYQWRKDLDARPSDVIRVYVLQGAEDSDELATFALVENDPRSADPDTQVLRVVEELRVREWRAGRAPCPLD